MINKLTLIILIILIFQNTYCQKNGRPYFPPINNLNITEDSILNSLPKNLDYINKLKNKFNAINDNLDNLSKNFELYAKTNDSDELVRVYGKEWPENTIMSFNIYRNSDNQIIYFAIYPSCESGDWFNGHQFLFDEHGRCKVYKRTSNFFNSECVMGITYESSIYYFDDSFELIRKEYSLLDENDNDISDKLCFFPYHFKYTIYSNVNSIGIK